MSNLEIVPPDIIAAHKEEIHKTAQNVFDSISSAQAQVYIIHGAHSERTDTLPSIHNFCHDIHEYSIASNDVVHFTADHVVSVIWSGLVNNTIIIHSKVNHVVLRRSTGVHLDITLGTVSGVDILHCQKSKITMPRHNYTNLEFGESINFQASIDNVSQLHITGSLDVKINDDPLSVNPFMEMIFTEEGWTVKKHTELSKLMLCKY